VQDFYNYYWAFSKSDTVDEPERFLAFYVGVAGDVVVVGDDGRAITFKGCLAGHVYRVRGKRINSTSTTATDVVLLTQR